MWLNLSTNATLPSNFAPLSKQERKQEYEKVTRAVEKEAVQIVKWLIGPKEQRQTNDVRKMNKKRQLSLKLKFYMR